MRIQKTRTLSPFPDYSKIKDEIIKEFCQNLGESLIRIHRDTYDDLISMKNLDAVASLPTAASEYQGRLVLLKGTGNGADTLYLGINTGSSGYSFKKIALT